VREISVIGADVELSAKEHRSEFAQGLDDAEESLLDGGAVLLSGAELAGVVSDRASTLFDDSA